MKAIEISSDRAEPYYYWSIYCNKHGMYDVAHEQLTKALCISYDKALLKYGYVQRTAYGTYLHEELAISTSKLLHCEFR